MPLNPMPKRPNRDPSGEWKAIVLSYDYIFSLSEKKCSYCLNEQQAMALVQIAEYLAWQTRWIDAAAGKDRDKLAAFSAGIQDILMSGCCGDEQEFIIRYDDAGLREVSYDGGATWQPDPDPDPRFIGTYYPVPNTIPAEDLRCFGAQNIVNWFHEQQTRTADALGLGGGVAGIIAAILSLIVLYVGITLTSGLATPLLIGLASALAVTTAEAFNAAMNEDVYDRLLCTLYCNIGSDGSVSQAQWQEIKDQVIEDEEGIAFRFIFDNLNTLGTIGLSNISRSGAATSYDCSGCDCSPPCVEADNIIIGDFVSQTEDEITIAGVLTTHAGITAYWVRYGSDDDTFCCDLCEVTYIPDVSSGDWTQCTGAPGGGTPVGQSVRNLNYYRAAPFSIRFRFKFEGSCD